MADTPENTPPEGEQVAGLFGDIGRTVGESVRGIGPIVEGSGVIEAQRALQESNAMGEMLNSIQGVMHQMQDAIIRNLDEPPADEEVIEAEPPQELQASAAGGEVAIANDDSPDDGGGYDADPTEA